ncbi:Protein of unknown function [Bacillus wiedmannii]|nr:Protein of unknown function [Bacillus wiedmannii]
MSDSDNHYQEKVN